jgi:alkyl hydroperoxide reductase subunit AhpC
LKEDEGVAFRGLFIIDDQGNLRQITINDMPVGRSVEETLRLVQAFQFTDKHGEGILFPHLNFCLRIYFIISNFFPHKIVCPANWKPGKKGNFLIKI